MTYYVTSCQTFTMCGLRMKEEITVKNYVLTFEYYGSVETSVTIANVSSGRVIHREGVIAFERGIIQRRHHMINKCLVIQWGFDCCTLKLNTRHIKQMHLHRYHICSDKTNCACYHNDDNHILLSKQIFCQRKLDVDRHMLKMPFIFVFMFSLVFSLWCEW